MKYIVTGINGGLGKYLYENIPNSLGIDRTNLNLVSSRIEKDDVIVHCAFNKSNEPIDLNGYLEDNIFLTKKLLKLGNRMIYISSIDVYLQNNLYAQFKKFGEALVSSYPNNLILRCPALVGEHMKPNHLHKIMSNETIGLSEKSTFNYILYSDVLDNIFDKKIGTYELVTKENASLDKVKRLFQSNSNLGTYLYMTPKKFTNPIVLDKTSIDTLKSYFI